VSYRREQVVVSGCDPCMQEAKRLDWGGTHSRANEGLILTDHESYWLRRYLANNTLRYGLPCQYRRPTREVEVL
jgi:hypothetical protein